MMVLLGTNHIEANVFCLFALSESTSSHPDMFLCRLETAGLTLLQHYCSLAAADNMFEYVEYRGWGGMTSISFNYPHQKK